MVIGSGIAGLTFAIKVAEAKPEIAVLVLTKSNNEVCSTAQAQGGIAVVLDKVRDSFEQHIADTLKAGQGKNDPEVVKMVISQAPERLKELIGWGTSFDTNELGELELGLEGGHSQKRIVHHRDLTGREMETKLLQKAASLSNITFYDHYFITDLLTGKKDGNTSCIGAKAIDKNHKQQININSRITFLATGGSGRIFENTTNPSVATGDGVAMAYRAGAEISNMHYIQFHPTALYTRGQHALFLISEAVRGFGAYVVNAEGERFLFKHDHRGELATRDIVSEAIVKELKFSEEESAFLDCRHLDPEAFEQHFPTIVNHCTSMGIDFKKDLLPIVPAAHYQCGGIEVDKLSATGLGNLYASGECAHTGLHGTNRLASNSLLEALVFSHQAAGRVVKELGLFPAPELPQEIHSLSKGFGAEQSVLEGLAKELNKIMTYDLLYSSRNNEKELALDALMALDAKLKMYPDCGNVTYFETRNMITTARVIIEHSMELSDAPQTHQLAIKTLRRKDQPELA